MDLLDAQLTRRVLASTVLCMSKGVRVSGVCLALLAAIALTPRLIAQTTLFFDAANGAGLGAGSGSTTWNSTTWNTNANGNPARVAWTNGDLARFNAGSGTYSVNVTTAGTTFAGATVDAGNVTISSSGSGTMALSANSTFTVTAGSLAISTAFSGAFNLIKAGANTLTLSNTDTYTGSTTISAGTLQLGDGTNNGNLTGTSGVTNNATLAFNEGTATTFSKAISGTGAVTVSGAGATTFNVANSYTGTTTVNSGGTLNLQNSSALGTGSAGATVNSGGALELQGGVTVANEAVTLNGTGVSGNGALRSVSGTNTWNNNITLGSAATINSSTTGNLLTIGTYNVNTITMGANMLTLDGAGDTLIKSTVGAVSDSGGFVKNGAGTTTFQGFVNNYTGTTTVNAGTLVLDTANSQVDKTILGNLVIGAGTGSANSVIVRYGTGSADNKIANTSQVTINSDGELDMNNRNDTIGSFVLNGGHINSGSGVLTLNGNITTNTNSANRTAVIDGNVDLGGATRTFTVANGGLTSDLTVNAVINNGSFIKAGAGTMTITADNTIGYGGTTAVNAGVLNIQNSNALGQNGNNNPTMGTTVASGAALQVQGGISVGNEALTLNGTGVSNDGALRNISGTNSWGGTVTLGSNARINSDSGSLTIAGDFTGTTQSLTVGGSGNTTLSGAIGTGTGALTKDGSGTLTLSGTTTSTFTGGFNANDGTVVLNKTAGLNATGNGNVTVGDGVGAANSAVVQLNQSEQISNSAAVTINSDGKLDLNGQTETIGSLAGSGTLTIGSGALIVGGSSSTTFSGAISGTGSLTKQGTGTLTISSNISFGGNVNVNAGKLEFTGNMPSIAGTLTLGAGSTLLLNLTGANATLSVGTIHITGNTVIDFGSASNSILSATTFIIDSGVTLVSITNWTNTFDYFYAQSWTGATLGTVGAGAPETQVTFSGYSSSQTAWLSYDRQITPAPEPSTYGFMLTGAGLALIGYRRRISSKKQKRGA
jgi:fibronectin-binding autotransporter adhesin